MASASKTVAKNCKTKGKGKKKAERGTAYVCEVCGTDVFGLLK
ncbi:MAG: hypothetical protein Q8O41_04805 [Candidatus Methanoperedens sp.]|nr:hypothetical protein [Candidatus Methanoperedens sp.]